MKRRTYIPAGALSSLFTLSCYNRAIALTPNHKLTVESVCLERFWQEASDAERKLYDMYFDVATANHIGMREGRRIRGRYLVTLDDLKKGARFDDAVCRVTAGVNYHSLNSSKSLTGENYTFKTKPWDIPLRSLIAKDVDGIMMAGRSISEDFWAYGSYRMTGSAVSMGEAAGQVAT